MIIRQFVSHRSQMFRRFFSDYFPQSTSHSVSWELSVLKADAHWSLWFPQMYTAKFKEKVQPVHHG